MRQTTGRAWSGTAPESRLGYAAPHLSEHPVAIAPTEHDPAVVGQGGTRLGTPRAQALLWWLGKTGSLRYRYRFLQGLALSLTVNQCALLWIGQLAHSRSSGQLRLFASTAYWSLGLALVAGWVLLGGWFDGPTRSLFEQVAMRRGYESIDCRRLETMASWRWLSMVLAFPCLVFGAVAAARIASVPTLGALALNLILCLVGTQLTAACVILAVTMLRKLETDNARRLWLLACLIPEAIRPILPGFPSIRVVASGLEQLILRWGANG